MNKKVLVSILCIFTLVSIWITFTHVEWLSQVQEIVQGLGAWGAVIFVVIYAIASLLILPVTAFNIAGGALYGGLEGILLTSLGALLSALLGFVLARSLGTKFIAADERWSNVSQNLVSGGIAYSFAARLLPLIPYSIISFAAGLSPIKRRDYLIGTILGTPLGLTPFVLLGSTGTQMNSSHGVLPLLASSLGLAVLVVAATWYKFNKT